MSRNLRTLLSENPPTQQIAGPEHTPAQLELRSPEASVAHQRNGAEEMAKQCSTSKHSHFAPMKRGLRVSMAKPPNTQLSTFEQNRPGLQILTPLFYPAFSLRPARPYLLAEIYEDLSAT